MDFLPKAPETLDMGADVLVLEAEEVSELGMVVELRHAGGFVADERSEDFVGSRRGDAEARFVEDALHPAGCEYLAHTGVVFRPRSILSV